MGARQCPSRQRLRIPLPEGWFLNQRMDRRYVCGQLALVALSCLGPKGRKIPLSIETNGEQAVTCFLRMSWYLLVAYLQGERVHSAVEARTRLTPLKRRHRLP